MSQRPGINRDFLAADLDLTAMRARFAADSRDVYTHRTSIVQAFGAQPGENVAELGAGTGVFAGLLAQAVGPHGKVYALDMVPKFVSWLADLAAQPGMQCLHPRLCGMQATGLAVASVDRVLLCDTYHHLEYPQPVLADLHAAIRPGGRLMVVDFDKIPGRSREFILGHVRTDRATVTAEIRAAGFELLRADELGMSENYALQFARPLSDPTSAAPR